LCESGTGAIPKSVGDHSPQPLNYRLNISRCLHSTALEEPHSSAPEGDRLRPCFREPLLVLFLLLSSYFWLTFVVFTLTITSLHPRTRRQTPTTQRLFLSQIRFAQCLSYISPLIATSRQQGITFQAVVPGPELPAISLLLSPLHSYRASPAQTCRADLQLGRRPSLGASDFIQMKTIARRLQSRSPLSRSSLTLLPPLALRD
jgi:hypothetical protein